MVKICKIAFISILLLCSGKASAQLDQYLADENRRIEESNQIEKEIVSFINDNFKNYRLSKETTNEVIQHLREEEEFSDEELQRAIANAKIYELRKLFFVQNPDKKEFYIAKKPSPTIMQTCVNGDFENNTAGYTFWSDAYPQPDSGEAFFLSCATPTTPTASNMRRTSRLRPSKSDTRYQ